jgi:hypothetical protein
MVSRNRVDARIVRGHLFRPRDGQTMAEYGALILLSGNINTVIGRIADAIG